MTATAWKTHCINNEAKKRSKGNKKKGKGECARITTFSLEEEEESLLLQQKRMTGAVALFSFADLYIVRIPINFHPSLSLSIYP